MSDQNPPGYLLGEMAATVKNIDTNVNAIRNEISDITKRLGQVEQELSAIDATKPENQAFVKTVKQHMIDMTTWKNHIEGGAIAVKGGGKLLHTILAALFTLALFIAGQVWTTHSSSVVSAIAGPAR